MDIIAKTKIDEINKQYANVWTIELNLKQDPRSPYSWHIELLNQTQQRNMREAYIKKNMNPWVLVGLASTYSDAEDFCEYHRREFIRTFVEKNSNNKIDDQ